LRRANNDAALTPDQIAERLEVAREVYEDAIAKRFQA
jgi:hypothetical protein